MNNILNNFEKCSNVESCLIVDGCNKELIPELSIMIPTFRRPHLLKETIDSIIQQRVNDVFFELVIVDNDAGSSDGILEELLSGYFPYNIRLYRNKENIGMFGNWNRCIELARAPVLTILNDDDLLHPDFIKSVYKPDIREMRAVTHTTFSNISNAVWSRSVPDVKFTPLVLADFFNGNPVPGSLGMVMNKQCAINIGGYNADLWPTADYDFTYRYFSTYGLHKTTTRLSAYRWSENESLKVETLAGFLKNDYRFRTQLIQDLKYNAIQTRILKFVCNLISVYFAFIYKNVNPDFNIMQNLRNALIPLVGVSFFKIRPIHHLFGYIYPYFLKYMIR